MTTIMNLELYSLYVFPMNEMTLEIHLTTILISLDPEMVSVKRLSSIFLFLVRRHLTP